MPVFFCRIPNNIEIKQNSWIRTNLNTLQPELLLLILVCSFVTNAILLHSPNKQKSEDTGAAEGHVPRHPASSQ